MTQMFQTKRDREAVRRDGSGYVAPASSFTEVEDIARHTSEAKGIVWSRDPHAKEAEIEHWVAGQAETVECYSSEQLRVMPPSKPREHEGADAATPPKRAKLTIPTTALCVNQLGREVSVAGPDEVQAACARVVATLPTTFQEPIRRDAEALTAMLLRLCPNSPWLTLRIEIVAKIGACTRWHQDRYAGRAIITYVGPGTWCADDKSVRYDQFALTQGAPMEVSDTRIVPNAESMATSPGRMPLFSSKATCGQTSRALGSHTRHQTWASTQMVTLSSRG